MHVTGMGKKKKSVPRNKKSESKFTEQKQIGEGENSDVNNAPIFGLNGKNSFKEKDKTQSGETFQGKEGGPYHSCHRLKKVKKGNQ